jgi:phosphatidylinositol alpha 1,6-mannosyltransferase
VRRLHNAASLTLSPSTASAADLTAHGVERVAVWGRGVDTGRFNPAKRNASLRADLAPGGEVIVGYVGRLAAEKRVDLLSEVAALPGVRLVIVGGGPAEAEARRGLPGAVFLGQRQGDDLAAIYAVRDVRQHVAGGRGERPADRGARRGRPDRPGGRGSHRVPGKSRRRRGAGQRCGQASS